ncbi:MAG: hypothetical protein IJT28_02640 [Bacteroidaceae bacterium]|nr:hypothetical protein [Bacteroidaceae bacterium]
MLRYVAKAATPRSKAPTIRSLRLLRYAMELLRNVAMPLRYVTCGHYDTLRYVNGK